MPCSENIRINIEKTKLFQKNMQILFLFSVNALFIYKHLENPNVFCKLEMETGL
jgi:hypothetical protein